MSTAVIKYRNWLFIGFIVVSSLLSVSLVRNLNDLLKTQDRFSKAEEDLQQLEAEKNALRAQIDNQNHDYVTEKTIRDQLGLAKPGEKVVLLPEDLEQFIPPTQLPDIEEQLPNWRKWYNLFF